VPGDSSWDKCYLNLIENDCGFQERALPLAAVYLLGERCENSAAPFVEAVPANSGLIAVIANTYANYLLDKVMRAQEFELLSRVIASVPLRRVIPHANPAYLSKLCDIILDDFHLLSDAGFHEDSGKERNSEWIISASRREGNAWS